MGTDLSIFIGAEKGAFNITHVKTDLTQYYKDCQDQSKSSTTAQCLKDKLLNPASSHILSQVTKFVLFPLGHSQTLGVSYKLVYRSSPLLLQAIKRNNNPCLLLMCCSLLSLCSINISIDYNCSFAQLRLIRM